MNNIPIVPLNWSRSFRIIPTLFPERTIFDEVCSEAEIAYVCYIESLTNVGERSTPMISAFSHVKASRFNTDYFGAYYVHVSE